MLGITHLAAGELSYVRGRIDTTGTALALAKAFSVERHAIFAPGRMPRGRS
jgi:hypothetical protein